MDSNIDSCDVLVSFIVIVKKAAEQPDIPKTDTKAGLKAAIDLAKTLKADDYTAASYKALSDTIASAEKYMQKQNQVQKQSRHRSMLWQKQSEI